MDGPKELDGEVLELTIFGHSTDMRLRHDVMTSSLALLMAFFLVHDTALEWIFPMFSPDSPHSSHSIFDA